MFSILILTGNEELNIRECLESVSWCDDVWVLDCGSKDRTVEIAKEMGANVITRSFDNFGNQRNYGIDNCKWKHEWVFDLDADERFTPEFVAAEDAISVNNPVLPAQVNGFDITWTVSNNKNYEVTDGRIRP